MKKNLYTKECTICGKVFETRIFNKKYCDSNCAKSKIYYQKKDHLKWKKCILCNNDFKQKNIYHMLCSDKCRKIHYHNKYINSLIATKRGRYIIFQRDRFTCFYCGKKSFKHWIELHCEHIVPLKYGGNNEASNLVTSCKSCNLSKGQIKLDKLILDDLLNEIKNRNKINNIYDKTIIILK